MADKNMTFRFFGKDETYSATTARMSGETKKAQSHIDQFATAGLLGMAAMGVASIKMAGNFQEGMTTLVTGAGESEKNIKLVGDGILKMAGQVGVSTKQLTDGMYMIESAGFHGAAGLNVLKVAAMGAKVGNADLGTVANAVTSALNAYHLPASKAAAITNTLVSTVAQGKMHMQDLAGALGNVLPIAAKAGVSLAEVGAGMATMTAQGVDASNAATFLRQTIGKLEAPTKAQADEMGSMGLSAIDLSSKLGTRGLAGTLEMMTNAIQSKMGPAGIVTVEHLKKMAASTTGFQKALLQLPPTQQTYVGALAAMMGGTKTLQGALLLTGSSMKDFHDKTSTIGAAANDSSGKVLGWSAVQKDFNQQISQATEGLKAMGIRIGDKVIPVLMEMGHWINQNRAWLVPLVEVVGTAAIAWMTVVKVTKMWAAAQALLNVVMTANPIGIIIMAVAALAVGLIYAYNHSKTFRDIVGEAFHFVASAVTLMWGIIRPILKLYIDLWMEVVGVIVHGAASAFGWVPGIGKHLKNAAREFDHFKDSVNNALGGVKDKHVGVTADLVLGSGGFASNSRKDADFQKRAAGGPVVAGQTYVIGENGPELFKPAVSGHILPTPTLKQMAATLAGGTAMTSAQSTLAHRLGIPTHATHLASTHHAATHHGTHHGTHHATHHKATHHKGTTVLTKYEADVVRLLTAIAKSTQDELTETKKVPQEIADVLNGVSKLARLNALARR